jgi:hypothetical protein
MPDQVDPTKPGRASSQSAQVRNGSGTSAGSRACMATSAQGHRGTDRGIGIPAPRRRGPGGLGQAATQSTLWPAPGVRTRAVILAVATLEATSQAPAPVQIVTVPPRSSPSSTSRLLSTFCGQSPPAGNQDRDPSGRVSAHSPCQHDRWLLLTGRERSLPATSEIDRDSFNADVELTGAGV